MDRIIAKPALRISQRLTIIYFFCAPGPDSHRCGVDDKLSVYGLDVCELGGDICTICIKNRI